LACMAYVDLNPIRAGLADRPEDSEYTSVKERIDDRHAPSAHPAWLCPIGEGSLEGRRGMLSMTRDEYLSLIDWTGRQIRSDKPEAIPCHLAPLLGRLEINQARWVGTVTSYGSLFHRVAGRVESTVNAARQAGKCWLAGICAGKQAFSYA
jgi:putative transposase